MFFFVSLHKKLIHCKKMNEINEYRQELRKKIIDYAMPEFYKRGIKAVKMDEISQGLHVSKRTVYEIFGDKEELLLAGMRDKRDGQRLAMENFVLQGNHNVIDMLSFFYKQELKDCVNVGVLFYEEIHKMPRVLEFLQCSHEQHHENSLRFFKEGVKEGLFRADMDFKLFLQIVNIAMEEIMHRQLYKEHSMQEIFDNYILVLIRGFCTERGLVLLNKAID